MAKSKYRGSAAVAINELDKHNRLGISALYKEEQLLANRQKRSSEDLKAFIFGGIPMPEDRTAEDIINYEKFLETLKEKK